MRRSFIRTCGIVLGRRGHVGDGRRPGNRSVKLLDQAEGGHAQCRRRDLPARLLPGGDRRVQAGATRRHDQLSGRGFGAGPHRLHQQGDRLRRAATLRTRRATAPADPFLYFPTVVAPITVAYNLRGCEGLKLSPETDGEDLLGADHDLERRGDQGRQPEGQAARARDHRRAPVRRLRHHPELHELAGQGGTDRVDPRHRFDGAVAGEHPGRARQPGRGQPGPGHATARSATSTSRTPTPSTSPSRRSRTRPASSSRRPWRRRPLRSTVLTINPDLTFDPINAPGAKAYPITSPTWIMVYTNQTDAKKGAAIKGFLNFIYGTPRPGTRPAPSRSTTPRCRPDLLKQAKAQVNKIVLPATT